MIEHISVNKVSEESINCMKWSESNTVVIGGMNHNI
jgi:hypothetical protein